MKYETTETQGVQENTYIETEFDNIAVNKSQHKWGVDELLMKVTLHESLRL